MNFEMIPAKELDRYTDRQYTFLIDVRPPEEYQQSHIRGAVNIPYQYLSDCCRFPREKTLILYCDRGATSMAAARELAKKGCKVKTVIGGIRSYRGKKLEIFH